MPIIPLRQPTRTKRRRSNLALYGPIQVPRFESRVRSCTFRRADLLQTKAKDYRQSNTQCGCLAWTHNDR